MLKRIARLWRRDRGAAVVEFALVIPIFFTIIFGIIQFSRAYSRLNALNSSLREGARKASTMPSAKQHRDSITAVVRSFSSSYGFAVDTSAAYMQVTFGNNVTVGVTNYPIFAGLNFLGGPQSITV